MSHLRAGVLRSRCVLSLAGIPSGIPIDAEDTSALQGRGGPQEQSSLRPCVTVWRKTSSRPGLLPTRNCHMVRNTPPNLNCANPLRFGAHSKLERQKRSFENRTDKEGCGNAQAANKQEFSPQCYHTVKAGHAGVGLQSRCCGGQRQVGTWDFLAGFKPVTDPEE